MSGNGHQPRPHPYAVHLLEARPGVTQEQITACGKRIQHACEDTPHMAILPAIAAVLGGIMLDMPFERDEQYKVMTDYLSIAVAAIARQTR